MSKMLVCIFDRYELIWRITPLTLSASSNLRRTPAKLIMENFHKSYNAIYYYGDTTLSEKLAQSIVYHHLRWITEDVHWIRWSDFSVIDLYIFYFNNGLIRGRPLMIWGGGRGNRKKKIRRPFSRKNIWRGYRKEKINSFSNFPPPPPQSLMVDSLVNYLDTHESMIEIKYI